MQELGIRAPWEVIEGEPEFFAVAKGFHNALSVNISKPPFDHYVETNERNAETLHGMLDEADFVFIHYLQPAALLRFFPHRRGKWIWCCHIDVSRPHWPIWKSLRDFVCGYDAKIFRLATASTWGARFVADLEQTEKSSHHVPETHGVRTATPLRSSL